ncbi:MAG: type pullulanase, partial [Bacteroidota bacterium]
TQIEIFAPAAEKALWLIYETDDASLPILTIELQKSDNGFFHSRCQGNLIDKFYAFSFFIQNQWTNPTSDILATATGINGKKAAVIDFSRTNPKGWEKDQSPNLSSITDAVIYELHIRDFTIQSHSGLYNGFTEIDTISSGLNHLKELGITHIQLMPVFDFDSVDESFHSPSNYNWGYDPYHWNVPEGSYSTNPSNPYSRIKELKSLILSCHKVGIGVIMDVVYNHFSSQRAAELERIAPGVFFRKWKDGSLANGSGCGNEIATQNPMVREIIIQSLEFWVKEYHIDGFRFDLMGLIDLQTLEEIKIHLQRIKPGILLYGEGWSGGNTPFLQQHRGIKNNTHRIGGIGLFNDDFRDGVKGHVFNHHQGGLISGFPNLEESVKFGLAGAVYHPQIDYSKVNYSDGSWAFSPSECINYISCHDNLTLWDKINLVNPTVSTEEKKKIHKLGLTLLLLAQGIPFLHSGVEFLRSKNFNDNSYKAGDSINQLDWNLKNIHTDVFEYVKNLIELRKNHPAFRCTSGYQIRKFLKFMSNLGPSFIAFELGPNANNDPIFKIFFAANGSQNNLHVNLPPGKWKVIIQDYVFLQNNIFAENQIDISSANCILLFLLD